MSASYIPVYMLYVLSTTSFIYNSCLHRHEHHCEHSCHRLMYTILPLSTVAEPKPGCIRPEPAFIRPVYPVILVLYTGQGWSESCVYPVVFSYIHILDRFGQNLMYIL